MAIKQAIKRFLKFSLIDFFLSFREKEMMKSQMVGIIFDIIMDTI